MSELQHLSRIAKSLTPAHSLSTAYNAGYDAGINGPNTSNCHFSLFCSREHTRAWETGKRNAEQRKAKGAAHEQG